MNLELTPGSLPPCRPVRKRAGQYYLSGEIGDGGMATVYVGHQCARSGLKRTVAVKILHEHLSRDRDVASRFLDEMRLVSLIDHPFVCKIFDHGETLDGRPYFAMEYLMGEPLWRVLRAMVATVREPGKLVALDRVAFVVRVIAGLAEGLHAAHEARDEQGNPLNVIHRDISPQNLFVLYDGTVRLVDFGVARHETTTRHTKTGAIMGKLPYLAPEHVHGETYDRRLDIWSLGVVLWELLACRRLFRRPKEMPTLRAICYDPVPSLAEMGVGDEELDAIVLRALERNVQKRTRTAREFATALERWLSHKNVSVSAGDISDQMQLLFPGCQVERERWARSSPEVDIYDSSDHKVAPHTDIAVDPHGVTATRTLTSDERMDEATPILSSALDSRSHVASTTFNPEDTLSIIRSSLLQPRLDMIAAALAAVPAATPERRVRPNLRAVGSLGLAFTLAVFAFMFGAHALEPPATLTTPPVRAAARLTELPRVEAPPSTSHDSDVTLVSAAEISPLDKAPVELQAPLEQQAPPLKKVAIAPVPLNSPPAPPATATAPPSPVPAEFGDVYVTTTGGKATVLERGRVLGTTPLRVRLPTGTHVLELAPLGGGSGTSVTTTVTAGGTALVSARLASDRSGSGTDSGASAARLGKAP